MKSAKIAQADGKGLGYRARTYLKKRKRRLERRRANIEPEAPPFYNRYRGWLT